MTSERFSSDATLRKAGFTNTVNPRQRQKPTREAGGMHDDYIEKHPAYAMIGASRVSSTPGAHLFGSDFRHQHYMTITIRRADLRRGGNTDWPFGDQQLIEVALSEAQWATFVSTTNVGHGTPCTLDWLVGEGYQPYIQPTVDRKVQFHEEMGDRLEALLTTLDALNELTPTKKGQALIASVRQQVSNSLPWVAEQFDEHAEKTVEKMKIEVAAYVTAAINRAGITALGGTPDMPILLEAGEDEEEVLVGDDEPTLP